MSQKWAEDVNRLYSILDDLERRLVGTRTLHTATGGDAWPSHGLYFFFEPGETRADGRPRVVRVGTHALTPSSHTTLWNRLSQHRGTVHGSNPGGGNHRSSIFRHHVGTALLRRDKAPEGLVNSWLSKHPQAAWAAAEAEHEKSVSRHIRAMPLLWLPVPTKPDGTSERGYLERNCIGLLSGADATSTDWLGRYAMKAVIVRSGLWNVNHIDDGYRREGLDRLNVYLAAVPAIAGACEYPTRE